MNGGRSSTKGAVGDWAENRERRGGGGGSSYISEIIFTTAAENKRLVISHVRLFSTLHCAMGTETG